MMWKSYVLLLLTIMFNPFCISFARAEWLQNGKPVFDNTYAKTDGDFGAMIIFTDEPSDLFNAWNKDGLGVEASLVEKVKREKTLVALIVFSNCSPDPEGMANVSVTFSLLDPANNIIKKTGELEVWMHKPSPQKQDLELSVQYLSVKIGRKDSSGLYTVKALVNDKNSGRKLSLEKKFEVFE